MLRLVLSVGVLVSVGSSLNLPRDESIAIVWGGDGGGVEGKVVIAGKSCKGSESFPRIPPASFSAQNGWAGGHHTLNGGPGDMILCGGKDLVQSDDCHMIELGADKWHAGSCKLPTSMTHASMVSTSDGSVIISGGYSDQIGWLDGVYKLESITPEDCKDHPESCCHWEVLPSMPGKPVYSHCSVMYDNNLVIMGGNAFDLETGLYDVDEMKILNMDTMEWTMSTIPSPRQRFGCVKTEFNGKSGILISGGFCHGYAEGSCDQQRLDDTHFYDWENKSWEDLGKPMSQARDGHVIKNIQGSLLAFGGDNKGMQINGVERWSRLDERWMYAGFDLAGFGTNNFAVVTIPEFTYICQ